ncbi:ubiquinol-cytochrome c reductase iron-sulfur subunit [Sinorhizobium fredii]|uniref:ubiquinol-cytochrome c reductase iron-sulfur subunit n=1 Tax=Rhizobium fredii TaxID=380 RepID=UPI0013E8C0B7|nr:ubiquinol-cytochrome c reductase iron-sulfur subunit [Sinorhizobium fredii]
MHREECYPEKGSVSCDDETAEPTKREFLYLVTAMAGVMGVAAASWPFIDQMRPDASTLAMASIEVDVSSLVEGVSLTVQWRGRPVFIRNRTQPATDLARSAGEGRENWIVMIGVCTHLGCVPLGQAGDFGGWLCPCHGSHYDTAGRIRKGPAPENLAIPRFEFVSEAVVRIG